MCLILYCATHNLFFLLIIEAGRLSLYDSVDNKMRLKMEMEEDEEVRRKLLKQSQHCK